MKYLITLFVLALMAHGVAAKEIHVSVNGDDIALGIGRFAELGAAAVDTDAAGAQQLFGAPPRGDAGGGDDLLQPDDARGRAHGR